MDKQNNQTWCATALHHLRILNDGTASVCCQNKSNFGSFSVGNNSIQEIFNSPPAKQIRQNLIQGIKDQSCQQCWDEEAAGKVSERMRANQRYAQDNNFRGLTSIELNLGNNCNLKCRTCNPRSSSTWMKEDYDLNYSNQISFKTYSNDMKKYHQQFDESSIFWDDLIENLSTIKYFSFYGGEPLLSEKMWRVLEICVDRGYAQDINIKYNTNGTVWPKQTKLWNHFKSVNLDFSIDGIGEQFEYMRYPAKWSDVQQTLAKAKEFRLTYPNMLMTWCITLSALNIYSLPEIVEVAAAEYPEFNPYLNIIYNPSYYNMSMLPTQLRLDIIKKLMTIPKTNTAVWKNLLGVINFIKNGNYNEDSWTKFLDNIKTHDLYRRQNFYSTFYEYGKLIDLIKN